MNVAIMQPYLFPYIGYWQLVNLVDTFVIFDDVNFIKQGYINRNLILVGGAPQRITLEVIGASSNKTISEIYVGRNSSKILRGIEQAYMKSEYFDQIYPILKDILGQKEKNLAKFIGYSLQKISNYLRFSTKFIYSSDIEKDSNLKAQDKVIEIVKKLNAANYINNIGGKHLYDKQKFSNENINLKFLNPKIQEYKQLENKFVSHLSIIDIMMFNSVDNINTMLNKYELV